MWVLGVPARGKQIIHDCLHEAILEHGYSDHGAYQRIDTGCTPFLLFLDKSIWQFEPSKPYGESGSLQLGDEVFAVRFTRYVHKSSQRTEGREDEELHSFHHELSDLLDKWKSTFTDSASQNWPLVFPQFMNLLYWNVTDIEYHHLSSICRDILKLPIVELPMEGHGRTIVRPRWTETEDSFVVEEYRVSIAINQELSTKMKLIALAHELSHYVFHYVYLQFFSQFSLMIQQQPEIESFIAGRLNEKWWDGYRNTTELRCDIITSLFIVPYQLDKMLEPIEKKTFSIPFKRVTPDGQRLVWLMQHFDEDLQVGWGHAEQISMEGLMSRLQARTAQYSPDWPLFERLANCVFNREACMKALNAREDKITEQLNKIFVELHKMASTAALRRGTKKLLRRVTREAFISELASGNEYWDPVILEIPRRTEIIGYYPLMPAPYALSNSDAEWTSWVCPLKVPSMTLDKWEEHLAREEKGLMLYPLNPVDIYLRSQYLSRL